VCKRIPGENLEIIESNINGDIYTLRREYNLDVNIPEVAKKLEKREEGDRGGQEDKGRNQTERDRSSQ